MGDSNVLRSGGDGLARKPACAKKSEVADNKDDCPRTSVGIVGRCVLPRSHILGQCQCPAAVEPQYLAVGVQEFLTSAAAGYRGGFSLVPNVRPRRSNKCNLWVGRAVSIGGRFGDSLKKCHVSSVDFSGNSFATYSYHPLRFRSFFLSFFIPCFISFFLSSLVLPFSSLFLSFPCSLFLLLTPVPLHPTYSYE